MEKKMEIKVETGFQTRRVQGVGYRVKGHRSVPRRNCFRRGLCLFRRGEPSGSSKEG